MNYSIGGRILDVYDDVGLKVLAKSPYFEKVASLPIEDPAKIEKLEDGQFGLAFIAKNGSVIRKFPLHDYPNTLLSNIYFDMTHEQLPPEAKVAAATQIKRASGIYGMKPAGSVEKLAAEQTVEGRNYISLGSTRTQEVDSPDVFGQLIDEYEANRDKYARDHKKELAESMVPAAEKFGFDIPADLKPFAIKDPQIDKEAFFAQCSLRKQLTQEHQEAAPLIDELLEKHADFEPKEVVTLLETFDKQYGLDYKWTRGMDPSGVLMEKQALHAVPFRGGMMKEFSDDEVKNFVSTNKDTIQKMFGKELADKIIADPIQIFCLPKASRDFFMAHMEKAKDDSPAKAQ